MSYMSYMSYTSSRIGISENSSRLRSVVPVPRAHAAVLHSAHFDFDPAILTIASLVRWIVTQAVLRADLIGDLSKGGPRFLQTICRKVSSARALRQFIHFLTRQIVQAATDVHPFELTEPAKILIFLFLRGRHKQPAEALELLRGKSQPAVVLTILQESIFNVIFRAHLNEIGRHTQA